MSLTIPRVLGIVLALAALVGAMVSLGAIYVLWSKEATIVQAVDRIAASTDRSLEATARFMEAVNVGRAIVKRKLGETEKTLVDVSALLNQAAVTTRLAGTLAGTHMSRVLRDLDTTLATLETTTKLVDDVVTGASKIPFVSMEDYKPEVPLSESMRRVRVAFAALPPQLGRAQGDLAKTAASIEIVRDDMKVLSAGLDEAEQAVAHAAAAAEAFRGTLGG
jgi:hypothetical protein